MRNKTIRILVGFIIGVEKVQRYISDLYRPRMGINRAARHIDAHSHPTILIHYWLNWNLGEMLSVILSNLLALYRYNLFKITKTIEKTTFCHINFRIACLFQKVTC